MYISISGSRVRQAGSTVATYTPFAMEKMATVPPAFLSPTSLARLILPVNVIAKGEL